MCTEWILRSHGGRRIAPLFAILFLSASLSRADFHEWRIHEIYSNAEGTVQFIELGCDVAGETMLKGQKVRCSYGGVTNVFSFPANLAQDSLNKKLLLATPGFANRPGAVPPDYIIPTNFVFQASGKVTFANVDTVNYSSLPNNGILSLTKSGSSWLSRTNSPKNFPGQSGSLVPVRILTKSFSGDEFQMSFATATGKTYVVEYKNTHSTAVWQTLTNVPGNGGIKRVTNQAPVFARIYRLRVP